MANSLQPLPLPLALAATACIALLLMLVGEWTEIQEEGRRDERNEYASVAAIVLATKRVLEEDEEEQDDDDRVPKRKRQYIKWDHERARACVHLDYWGSPTPLFNDRMFERTFRVTRRVADLLLSTVAAKEPFFTDRVDALGKAAICPKVKILMALKLLAYGCSPSAFHDYFQMGLSTGRLCLKLFCRVICRDEELCSVYLRTFTRADAMRVSALHEEQHGVPGMVGSLDCMHVGWKNCPVAWQGQEQGKEKHPTIVLEAMCDFNLWFWHVSFGWAGSLNDINIWERSSLLKAFLDGSWHENVDFSFNIAGKQFSKLWIMVDGIYPELARFVKTIQEPVDRNSSNYAKWQEASRKDVERGFGVLQRKFHVLVKLFEQWYVEDISDIVLTCVVLHNAMVAHRIANGETEGCSFYECPDEDVELGAVPTSHEVDEVDRHIAELEALRVLEEQLEMNNVEPLYVQQRSSRKLRNQCLLYAQKRWEGLYDPIEHLRLRTAIIDHLQQLQQKEL